jgi:AcrR family transcriptional regulator
MPERRTQQARRATTERRVLEAAIQLIAERGSRSVSLADIGLAAGYSRGIVTHQFGTKEDLLAAVVDHAQRIFAIDSETGGLEELLAFVEQYLRLLREAAPVGQAFLLLWAEAVAGEPALRPLFVDRDRSFRRVVADHIRRGIAEGSIRGDIDAHGTASFVLAVLRGVGLHSMLDPRAVSHAAVRTAALATLRRGLEREPSPSTRPAVAGTRSSTNERVSESSTGSGAEPGRLRAVQVGQRRLGRAT